MSRLRSLESGLLLWYVCVCGVVVVVVSVGFGTSRSVLDPSWFGLRPFPCVKGTHLRLGFKGPAPSLTQAEHEKFAPKIVNVLDKCRFVFSVASFQNSPVFAEVDKNPTIGRNTQKQHLQNSDQNLTRLLDETPCILFL